jgi:hypothetical protein
MGEGAAEEGEVTEERSAEGGEAVRAVDSQTGKSYRIGVVAALSALGVGTIIVLYSEIGRKLFAAVGVWFLVVSIVNLFPHDPVFFGPTDDKIRRIILSEFLKPVWVLMGIILAFLALAWVIGGAWRAIRG